jgi:esterase
MKLYYREYGQGRPVIMLHGLFGFSDNLQTLAKGLSETCWVMTPDHRNHGRSPHTDTHSYPEMAEDVRRFMEEKGVLQAAFVGHSMGGKVAMQLALDHPELVEKLVVVDIAPGQANDGHSAIFKALLAMDLGAIKTRSDAEAMLSGQSFADPATLQFLLKNITREPDGSYNWKMNLPVLWHSYANILAPVDGFPYSGPTLFVRGGRSNYIRDSDWSLIKKLFPQASVHVIQGAGHWVHVEQPAALLGLLRGFLAGD